MARIRTYNPDPVLPSPTATAERMGAAAGRGMVQAAQGLDALGKALTRRREQKEISRLNAEAATAQAELTVAWRESLRNADPNDDTLAARFLQEQVQPRLSQLGESVGTSEAKRRFETLAAGMNASFLVMFTEDMARLGATAARVNAERALDGFSAAVFQAPGAFESTYLTYLASLESDPNIDSATRVQLAESGRQLLAKSAAEGIATAFPEEFMDRVKAAGLDQDLNAQTLGMLERAAKTAADARRAEARQIERDQAQLARGEYIGQLIDETGAPIDVIPDSWIYGVINDPRLKTAAGAEVQNMLLTYARNWNEGQRTLRSDLRVLSDLQARLGEPFYSARRTSLDEIAAALRNNEITLEDYNRLAAAAAFAKSPEGNEDLRALKTWQEGFKTSITNSNFLAGKLDPAGDQRYAQFLLHTQNAYIAGRQRGVSHDDLVLNERSPHYLGRQVAYFIKSGRESMEDLRESARTMGTTRVEPQRTPLATRERPDVASGAPAESTIWGQPNRERQRQIDDAAINELLNERAKEDR